MANDHHSKIQSTTAILGGLREEVLPDDRLPPDSPERKKRDIERFNAMLVAAFIEMMEIKNIIIAHWKVEMEKAIQRFEIEMESYQKKASDLIMMVIPNQQQSKLSEDQLFQIQAIDKKFIKLLIKIDEKLAILDQKIKDQHAQLAALQQAKTQKQAELSQIWKDYLSHFDLKNMINFSIALPQAYQNVKGEREQVIAVDGYMQRKIMAEVQEYLKKESYSIVDINALIKNKMLEYLRQSLHEAWSFLPLKIREQAINERLKEPDIQSLLLHSISELISKDPLLNNKIRELHIIDQSISRISMETEANLKYKENLIIFKNHVEDSYKQFHENLLNKNNEYLLVPQSSQDIDAQISAHMESLDIAVESLDRNEKIYDDILIEIKSSSLSVDDLLIDINKFSDEVFQAKNSNKKPEESNLEEKLHDIEMKSELVIQAIKNKNAETDLIASERVDSFQSPKM